MANNRTFMEVPPEIDDPLILRRFLTQLLENLDKAFGNRGQTGFVDANAAAGISSTITQKTFSGQTFNSPKRYSQAFNFTNDRDIVDKAFVDNAVPTQLPVADTSYASALPGALYSQAVAQTMDTGIGANATKINEILTALRSANIIGI